MTKLLRLRKPISRNGLAAFMLLLAWPALAQTMVRLHTTQGAMDFRLLDAEAPRSVDNFLAYVRRGAYADTMIHRSVRSFVIQGGGYAWPATGNIARIATDPPVVNEFSAQRSNLRGTVAMAKLGSDPNSATSEWFVNLADNAANLDNQNGGFTVFARVTVPGMVVADRISALRIIDARGGNPNSPFGTLPVAESWTSGNVMRNHVVLVDSVTELPSQTDHDRIFNWLEATYPQYVAGTPTESGTMLGYTYRYYAATSAYLGAKDGQIWYYVPAINGQINPAGPIADLLAQAAQAGY